jgi:hypothetical protein
MERWWDDDDRIPKYSEKNLFWCHFVSKKFHVDWPLIEPGVTSHMIHGMATTSGAHLVLCFFSFVADFD